jgi:vesicle coat complex subunit
MDMLSDFLNNKHLSSATEPKVPTDKFSEPTTDEAWEETPEDVMTLCDLSHMNHQQRQEFHKNAVYSKTKPVRDSSH